MNHQGTQILESERLILRPFTMEDAQAMFDNWAKDPEVTRYLTWQAYTSVDEAVETLSKWTGNYSRDNFYLWTICLKDQNNIPIGSIDIGSIDDHLQVAGIGYCIGRAYWGQGITSEALRVMMTYLFEKIGFHRLIAKHHKDNLASGKVMEKVGMQYEGLCRGAGKDNQGNFVDLQQYAILKTDQRF